MIWSVNELRQLTHEYCTRRFLLSVMRTTSLSNTRSFTLYQERHMSKVRDLYDSVYLHELAHQREFAHYSDHVHHCDPLNITELRKYCHVQNHLDLIKCSKQLRCIELMQNWEHYEQY